MPISNSYTTVSDMEKAHEKRRTKLYRAFQNEVPEVQMLKDMPDEQITPSGRENLVPLDVTMGFGAHQVSDGGMEARTNTPALQEGTFSFVQTNARFFQSIRSAAFDRVGAHVVKELKYKSLKAYEAVARKFALTQYGFTSGTVALVSDGGGALASATSHTITLKDGFGLSSIDSASFLAGCFQVGERVALIRSAALVANSFGGEITAVSTTNGTISVTWDAAVDPADNDAIVFSNGYHASAGTITETDYNKWPVGFLDALTSSSVHGLATATADAWQAGYARTSGGRWGPLLLKKMKQGLRNKGGVELTDIIIADGVQNDVEAGREAARVYSNTSNFDLDMGVSAKGIKFHTSKYAPATAVIGWNRNVYKKKLLSDLPAEDGGVAFSDLHKAENRSGLYGGIDVFHARIVTNRGGMGYEVGLTEQ